MKVTNLRLTLFFIIVFAPAIILAQTDIKNNYTDSLGRKQGYWKKYSNDTLKYEGQFKDDIPYGEFKYYYYNGKVKANTVYSENGKVAKTKMYQPDEKLNGEGSYYDKKKDGHWIYYGLNGRKISDEYYSKGIKTGEWKYYYDDGKINRIENYKNNVKDGPFMEFYPDSVIKAKGNYANDKLNGTVQYYGLKGNVVLTGKYINDFKESEWMFFNDLGAGERKLTYKSGDLLNEEIIFTTKSGNKFISSKDIAYCEGIGKETLIKLNSGEEILSIYSLDNVERLLGGVNYFRVNHSFVIAFWSVKNRKTFSKENPVLKLNPDPGKVVEVDTSYMVGFMSWAGLIKYDK